MDELLSLARSGEHAEVQMVATGLSHRSLNWANGGYRRLGGGLADNLALTVTAIAPTLPMEKLALLVRLGLWYYLLDEWFDGSARGRADPRRLGDAVIGIARGRRPAAPGEPLGQELATLLGRFRRESRDRASMDAFVDAFVDGVAAAVEHAELTREMAVGSAGLPSDEEYLAWPAGTSTTVGSRSRCCRSSARRPRPPAKPAWTGCWSPGAVPCGWPTTCARWTRTVKRGR